MVADIIVAVVLLASSVIAFIRGFIREVLTIFGLVGALAAAYFGGPYFIPIVHEWLGVAPGEQPERLLGVLPYDMLGNILAYGSIFIVVIIMLSIISHILAETAKSAGLGAIDRSLGVAFGLARGILLLGLLYLPIHLMAQDETKTKFFENSRSHFYLEKTAILIAKFLPETTVENIEQKVEEGTETTREKLQKIDILQQDGLETPENEKSKSGYTDEFRDNMDRLFEQESDNNGRNLNE